MWVGRPRTIDVNALGCQGKSFAHDEVVEDTAAAAALAACASAKRTRRGEDFGAKAARVSGGANNLRGAIKIGCNDEGTSPVLDVAGNRTQNLAVVIAQPATRDKIGAANGDGRRVANGDSSRHSSPRHHAAGVGESRASAAAEESDAPAEAAPWPCSGLGEERVPTPPRCPPTQVVSIVPRDPQFLGTDNRSLGRQEVLLEGPSRSAVKSDYGQAEVRSSPRLCSPGCSLCG